MYDVAVKTDVNIYFFSNVNIIISSKNSIKIRINEKTFLYFGYCEKESSFIKDYYPTDELKEEYLEKLSVFNNGKLVYLID